jgi:hypothetical protein
MDIRRTSHSEVESFLGCERKHYYGYGLKIQGKYTSEALERGIMVHAGLAAYYKSIIDGHPHAVASAEALLLVARLRETSLAFDPFKLQVQSAGLLGHYFETYKDDYVKPLEVETDYLIPITDDYSIPVKIDLIYEDLRDGSIVVADHKVVDSFYTAESAANYPQLPKYVGALMSTERRIDRTEYNFIRHTNTAANKEDPSLRFARLPIELTRTRVLRTLEEQIRAANRIKDLRDGGEDRWRQVALRNTGACRGCPFQLLCGTELAGRPINDLIEFEYRPKAKRNEMNN